MIYIDFKQSFILALFSFTSENTDSLTDFIFGKKIAMNQYEFFRNVE